MLKLTATFLQLRFVCNMGQCFVKISFRFGNARLYFTDHDIYIVYDNAFVGEAVIYKFIG